jgi:hypothetical protein
MSIARPFLSSPTSCDLTLSTLSRLLDPLLHSYLLIIDIDIGFLHAIYYSNTVL